MSGEQQKPDEPHQLLIYDRAQRTFAMRNTTINQAVRVRQIMCDTNAFLGIDDLDKHVPEVGDAKIVTVSVYQAYLTEYFGPVNRQQLTNVREHMGEVAHINYNKDELNKQITDTCRSITADLDAVLAETGFVVLDLTDYTIRIAETV